MAVEIIIVIWSAKTTCVTLALHPCITKCPLSPFNSNFLSLLLGPLELSQIRLSEIAAKFLAEILLYLYTVRQSTLYSNESPSLS